MKNLSNYRQLITGSILLGFSLYFIVQASRFFEFSPAALGKYFDIKWILAGHILGGSLALLTGPFQLWKSFRQRNWKLHRVLGRVYIYSIFIAAGCALYLASTVAFSVNWMYAFSLHILASVWLATTLAALVVVKKKKFKLHEEWVMRSYLSTLAFVAQSFMIRLPFIPGTYEEHAATVIWLSWAIPLFVYDLYLGFKKDRKNKKENHTLVS